MHWILQENLFKETEWDNLIQALDRFNISYSVHKVVPFSGDLIPEPILNQTKVICVGSYSMRHTAKRNNWNPGVYDLFEMDFEVQKKHWGNLMLNYDSEVLMFKDVNLSEPSFIRPIDDSKYFAGKIFFPDEFHEWQRQIVDLKLDFGSSLTAETKVQICSVKEIKAEYRFWVINGKIVTKSLYKRGNRVMYDSHVDSYIQEFVEKCIKIWQPHKAFVIDVADTSSGMKIVEINTINASGFYAGCVASLVYAFEEMENEYE